jgi:uncharacterized integral membrane protein
MTFHEKSSWVVLVVSVPVLLVYAVLVVPQLLSVPVTEITWVPPMAFAIVGFVIANVLGNIVAAISNPAEAEQGDLRDRQINQYGVRVGSWLIVAASTVAMVLAMVSAPYFWIGNALFVGGMAASLTSAIAKIAAYRGTFQPW